MKSFNKKEIQTILDQLITRSQFNTYLNNCDKSIKIEAYVPEDPPNFSLRSCQNDMNKSYTDSDITNDWFITAKSSLNGFSYIHFKLSIANESMIYIVKTCTDPSLRNKGISKMLHYLFLI